MPLPRKFDLPVTAERPGWVTAGMIRLATLSLFVVGVGMIRYHLSSRGACADHDPGAGLAAMIAVATFGLTKRIEARLQIPGASEAFLLLLRRTGLPMLGLAFFLAWTVVYIGVWLAHPAQAFEGLGPNPRFADFFYYAVSTALVSPPGDFFAHSRGARSATMIEMLTAFALLTAYISSFVDWHRRPDPPTEPS